MTTELIRYDAMCTAIESCHAVDEVKDIRDKAAAIEAYARQAMNTDAERKAAEIRIRAERKAGKMLAEMERVPVEQRNPQTRVSGDAEPIPSEFQQAKQSANISDSQAKRWQKLAGVPDNDFEQAISDPNTKPTTSGIINADAPKAEKPMDADALWLWGRLRDFEKRIKPGDISRLMDELTDSMRDEVKRTGLHMKLIIDEVLK